MQALGINPTAAPILQSPPGHHTCPNFDPAASLPDTSHTCSMVGMQAVRAWENATAMSSDATSACSSSSVPSKPTSAAADAGNGGQAAVGGHLRCV